MMPIIIVQIIGLLGKCKLCRIAAEVMAACVVLAGLWFGFWMWVDHRESVASKAATEKVYAEVKAQTEAESARRTQGMQEAWAAANRVADQLIEKDKQNATLLARISELSRARNSAPCLDIDATRRLRELGKGGSPPGH